MYCVVILYQSFSRKIDQKKMEMKTNWLPSFFFFFFPGGCFVVESDVPQPDFKHNVFIGTA